MLSVFILLANLNWNILCSNYQVEQADSETIEYYGNNFFVIEIDENDETVKIINGESAYKTIDNETVKIKNPNIIFNKK
ncbi:LPS export ABC transporter periplasmic protein LptC [Candidatus Kinetoplastidibacterium galati]|uniref:Uncharacterized protein n=1 Tax=Candidatus Kinetoplastidibacterium galati TCC219 TaxID=1208921 RepID=M1MC14_9PROT|nr:LPS export ABC transporter periplasmic protein LptC [Candidatus Kinetoplastibacterium galatii]AGF49350.1 hypothetical protein ST1E_0090 [Candidatus Kinetoplastibacterium galatii TCC219]